MGKNIRTITVPLTLISLEDDGFHLLAEISIFGQKLFAVIDTGASRSVFNKSFLEAHLSALELQDSEQATTLFSTSSTALAVIPQLNIGRLRIHDYKAVALDLETVNHTYQSLGHPPIVGIIGSDLLLKYHAVVDYKKLRVFLHDSPPSN